MANFSPITYWLLGRRQLPHFNFLKESNPNYELGYILALDICRPLYRVQEVENQIFKNTWVLSYQYLERAFQIVEEFENPYFFEENIIDIDGEIARAIIEDLGEPPDPSYPIYIVTVGTGVDERVVYVGKTSISIKSRFRGGHSVALKLHDPKYNNLEKKVYFGCITFLMNGSYLPLEWIQPLDRALGILDSVESGLIYHFSPELNIMKKDKNHSKIDINLNIENHSNSSSFLKGKQIVI